MIVIGRKKLPDAAESGRQKYWGFVDRVVSDPKWLEAESFKEQHYDTATRGERTQPAARPAGEGVYAIVDHDSHAHLAYVLELPKELGPVEEATNIEEEASYVIAIKNPETPAPPGAGLSESGAAQARAERERDSAKPQERRAASRQEVQYPKSLQEKFNGKRFIPPNPSLLDYEGAELILISAAEDVQPILDSNSTRSMSPADRRQSSKTCAWRRAHIHLSRYSVAKWA